MRNSRKPIHRTKVKANLRRRKCRPRKRRQLSLQSPGMNQTQLRNRRKIQKTNLTKKKFLPDVTEDEGDWDEPEFDDEGIEGRGFLRKNNQREAEFEPIIEEKPDRLQKLKKKN